MSLLAVEGLRKAFGGLVAVDALSFTVAPGSIVGLIGPNGSGKTTALNLLSGALTADAGVIRFKGTDIARQASHRIARAGIARTFQLVRVIEAMSCRENVLAGVAFGVKPLWGAAADARIMELLQRVGLDDKAEVAAGELTYIDQKRLELARALALDPALLLLDEWLAGLNPSELKAGIALIGDLRRDGLSMIVVEHLMEAVRALCDTCVVMNAGRKIAEGPPSRVLEDPEVVRAYLGDGDA